MKRNKYSKNYMMVNVIKNKINISQNDTIYENDLYTFVGLDITGNRHVLGTYIYKNNNTRFYLDIFEEFKSKGIEKIYFSVIPKEDKLIKGIKISFPNTEIIDSLTMHIIGLWKVASGRSRHMFSSKIKKLYTKESYEDSKIEFDLLKEEVKDNHLVNLLFDKCFINVKQYYKYDKIVREFLFNHNVYTELHDKIRQLNDKIEFDGYDSINNGLTDTFVYLEDWRPYTKRTWVEIVNHCSKYFNNILEEVVEEV